MSLLLHFNTISTPFSFPKTLAPPSTAGKRLSHTSCQRQQGSSTSTNAGDSNAVHRRNLLLGLGGLYGATATTLGGVAFGEPVQPPDLSSCHDIVDLDEKKYDCCLLQPSVVQVVDFKPPSSSSPMRVRRPSHELVYDPEYLEKFKEAICMMKALPRDDPLNYMQQAHIHSAYCNDASDKGLLEVHNNWLFLPWHRYYIYFWERILGKLIGDPTFSVPYWNWDTLEGMRIPSLYLDNASCLYDDRRDHNHYSALLDYLYKTCDPNPTPEHVKEVVNCNFYQLQRMYGEDNLKHPELFMGKPVKAGNDESAAPGALETLQNTIHNWAGQAEPPNSDMGNLKTAALDPLFFAHHSNVDRMWDVYRSMRRKIEFDDPNWLNASFLFYDENRQLVKCKVKDCLDPQTLRYSYQAERLPWRENGVHQRYKCLKKVKTVGEIPTEILSEFGTQPRLLETPIRVLVQITCDGDKSEDIEEQYVDSSDDDEENSDDEVKAVVVLTIDGIEYDQQYPARVDVYVAKSNKTTLSHDLGDLAGSIVNVAHPPSDSAGTTRQRKKMLQLGITDLLQNIKAKFCEEVVVSLVPRLGRVTVGGVRIKHLEIDE